MKIFADTSVFLWAFNERISNSSKVLELGSQKQLEIVISENVLEELKEFFTNYHSQRAWFETNEFVTTLCKVIPREKIQTEMENWRGKIKEKDLEHLATVKHLKLDTLIAFDRDYEPFPEYITPKQFVKKLGLKPSETEY